VSTIEEKRALLFSTKIRFSPQLQSIREAAVDKIIQQNLLLTEDGRGLSVDALLSDVLSLEAGVPTLTVKDAKHSLGRLLASGRVIATAGAPEPTYALSDTARIELWMIQHESEARLGRVCSRMFGHEPDLLPDCSRLFLQCLTTIFSRLGEAYVRVLKGDNKMSDFVGTGTIDQVIQQVAPKESDKALTCLRIALLTFFAEDDPDCAAIKWNLAQNYYIARALGMDASGMLLSREAFDGAVFYLDTNVIIPAIEPKANDHTSAEVLVSACKQLGIELRACQISLDQLRNVTQYNATILPKVAAQVPDALAPKVVGIFFKLYREEVQNSDSVDFDVLFGKFYQASQQLSSIGVTVYDDDWFTEIGSSAEILQLTDALNASLEKRRRRPKRKFSAIHDAALIRWVEKERQAGHPNTWLITLDSSLSDTSWVTTSAKPLAITLDALLQWLSPMAASANGNFEASYARAIRTLLLPQETFFDTRDFLVFAELDWSCKELPAPDVEKCILSIRANLPLIDPSTAEGRETLSHHIAKFFADPGREFKKDLERLEQEKQEADLAFRQQMSSAENAWVAEIAEKEQEITSLRKTLDDHQTTTADRIADLETRLKRISDEQNAESAARAEKAEKEKLRRSALIRVAICALCALLLEAVLLFFVLRDGEGRSTIDRISKHVALLSLPQSIVIAFSWLFVGKDRFAALGWPFDKVIK